jgi:hypothetical protein
LIINTGSHKKRTTSERNRMRMRRRMQVEALLMKRRRAIAAQLNDLGHLKQHAEALQVMDQGKAARVHSKLTPARRIGSRKLIAPPLTIKLAEEQAGSLRLLVPECDPVRERFRSLAERALIEPTGGIVEREKGRRRRGRVSGYKEHIKTSHKD